MLRVWNVLLVILAFSLSLFGTFLTRSGVVNSIHSFTQSSIGPWFLASSRSSSRSRSRSCSGGCRSSARRRGSSRRSRARRRSSTTTCCCSRSASTILWGVVYPLLSEAVRGEAVVLGRSYYDFFLRVFGLPLLLLMGIGPLIAWRRASLAEPADDVPLADRGRARDRRRPARCSGRGARCRGSSRTRSRPSSPRRSCSSSCAARGPARRSGRLAGRVRSRRSSRGTGAATAATSSMPRSCCSRSGSRGRAPSTASPRRGSRAATSMTIGDYTLTYASLEERQAANATEIRAQLDGRARRPRARHARGGEERLHDRAAGLERGRDPQRPADRRGPVRHRRADRRRTARSTSASSSSRS